MKMLNKVPEITVYFWIIKILTTGMGETTSDFFVNTFNPVLVVLIAGVVLAISLYIQLTSKRYSAGIYWFAVVMVSVFGTMVADIIHIVLGVPYIVSSIFFLVLLSAIFIFWYNSEKTLSIHTITTHKREFFYWTTVLSTFALGTAVGDMTATTLQLGYLQSGVLFAILFVLPLIAYFMFGVSEVLTFWIAYILTRPLGASFADWMGVSHARGGLDWGTGPVSLVLFILILCYIGFSNRISRSTKK
jgi:uncharacterized membrane-anchored protein